MKVYKFEGPEAGDSLMSLSARRALDRAGLKLSLPSYQALPLETRRSLSELGEAPLVDERAVSELLKGATTESLDKIPEPSPSVAPDHLLEALGPERPLAPKVWQSLSPLDRYALVKCEARGRARSDLSRLHLAYEEIVGATAISTHLGHDGALRMVRITDKPETKRRAVAESFVTMSEVAFSALERNDAPKGNVLEVARLAGIMGAKKTSDWIPLCHPLALSHVNISFSPAENRKNTLRILCETEVRAGTGVEMEAMVGASAAALTIYDMLKGIDRAMTLGPTRLISKSGGQSDFFVRAEDP